MSKFARMPTTKDGNEGDEPAGSIKGMTPLQNILGQGHLSGMPPEDRTMAMNGIGNLVNKANGMVPVVGPLYRTASALADGRVEDAMDISEIALMRSSGKKGASVSKASETTHRARDDQ